MIVRSAKLGSAHASALRAHLAAVFLGSIPACGVEFVDSGEQTVPAPVVAALERSCATPGCHQGSAAAVNLDLRGTAVVNAIGRPSSFEGMPLITLGEVNRSYLALKMLAPRLPPGASIVGAPMPPVATASSATDVETILAWIGDAATTGGVDTDSACLTPPVIAAGDTLRAQRDIAPIFSARCSGTSCHGGGGTESPLLDGAAWPAALVNGKVVSGAEGVYVAPNDPQASYLWRKLNGTHEEVRGGAGQAMPVSDPLCADELGVIEAWIHSGAAF